MRVPRGAVTITEVLRERGRREPGSLACVIVHADRQDERYPVRSLLGRANAFARHLRSAAGDDERPLVCVCMYHGVDLLAAFLGAILAGLIPTMIAPPSPRMEREKYTSSFVQMLRHLRPHAVVTDEATLSGLDALQLKEVVTCELLDARGVEVRGDDADLCGEWPIAPPRETLLLQHSSGTTGLQKGVALSHEAVLNQIGSYGDALGLRDDDVVVSWLPLYHDMGLIACFLLPLLCGVPFVQMSPFDWVLRPAMLFQAIQRYRGTLCFLPNFAYEFLATSVRDEQIRDVSLERVRGFVNCSEPVSHRSHQRFLRRFSAIGARQEQLWACYAMAENVFAVAQSSIGVPAAVDVVQWAAFTDRHQALPATPDTGGGDVVEFVSNGTVIRGTEVRVVDATGAQCPDRTVGEVCIRGTSLFDGYYLRQDLTREAFTSDGWYRTGDLGYLADRELFVTGRKKDLIIVQGRNFYPSDIEAIVSDTKGIIPGRTVAFGLWDDTLGTEAIVVLAEVRDLGADDGGRIKLDIRKRVAEGLDCTVRDVHLLPPGWLVKSTAGKMARSENRGKYLRELGRRA